MKRLSLWMVSLPVALGLPAVAWAQRDPEFYGPHMMWGGWYGMFMGPLMMIIFVAVVVVLVVLAVRWFGGSGHGPSSHAQASHGNAAITAQSCPHRLEPKIRSFGVASASLVKETDCPMIFHNPFVRYGIGQTI